MARHGAEQALLDKILFVREYGIAMPVKKRDNQIKVNEVERNRTSIKYPNVSKIIHVFESVIIYTDRSIFEKHYPEFHSIDLIL